MDLLATMPFSGDARLWAVARKGFRGFSQAVLPAGAEGDAESGGEDFHLGDCGA